ncbi:MAG: HAD hydrolase-like protein [Verrucomicrobia bacterium]|nr:HAD hydrolase-like protein [Verrucomicrobiota bacterium]
MVEWPLPEVQRYEFVAHRIVVNRDIRLGMDQTLKLLAVDSDGCALDAMEVKHRTCFTPAIIEVWQLEQYAEAVTELALAINLYSRERGINRFTALSMLFQLLPTRVAPAAVANLPTMRALHAWVESAHKLSESSLEAAIESASGAAKMELQQVLGWTRRVNQLVGHLASPPAFEHVRETLAQACAKGLRVCVVSSATKAAIEHEWLHADIACFVDRFFGQEDGTKTDVLLRLIGEMGNPGAVLMVGDALGDFTAARDSGCQFFPIIPGHESSSWEALRLGWLDVLPAAPQASFVSAAVERFFAALPAVQ